MVSYVDSGSHEDMDASIFRKSIKAISPYFSKLADAGYAGKSLDRLRSIGLEAERAMCAATGGINTHRGAIFVIGLLAAASGAACKSGWEIEDPGRIIASKWGWQLLSPGEFTGVSNGIAVYQAHGITGARGEAASGFRNVYETGIPAYREALRMKTPDDAAAHTFFALLEKVHDTTLIHRGGIAGLEFAMESAAKFNLAGGVFNREWKSLAKALHYEFIRRNLSAGGVADLLSATIFLHKLDETIGEGK